MLSNTEPGLLDQHQKGRSSVVERESPKLRAAGSIPAGPEVMGGWCSGNTSVFGTAVGGSIPSLPGD